jgi:hypothetical protein
MLHSGRSTASTEGGAPPGSGETWLKDGVIGRQLVDS